MIRVTQIFTCSHQPVPAPTKTDPDRVLPTHLPVKVRSQGHSMVMEARYCLCTGEPIPMRREIEHYDPDAGKQR